MKIETIEKLRNNIKDFDLLKKLIVMYDGLNDRLIKIIEESNYNVNVIYLIVNYYENIHEAEKAEFYRLLEGFVDANYDDSIAKMISLFADKALKQGNTRFLEGLNEIIDYYQNHKNDQLYHFIGILSTYKNRYLDIIELMNIYEETNHNELIKNKLLCSNFSLKVIKYIIELIKLSDYNENITNLIINNCNNENLDNIVDFIPLCRKYKDNGEILMIIFRVALNSKDYRSVEEMEKILDVYAKYQNDTIFNTLFKLYYLDVEYAEVEKIVKLYNMDSPEISGSILYKQFVIGKTIDEIIDLINLKEIYPNVIVEKIIFDDNITSSLSVQELKELVSIYNQTNSWLLSILLEKGYLKDRSFDEIKEYIELGEKYKDWRGFILEIINIKVIRENKSVSEIDKICDIYINNLNSLVFSLLKNENIQNNYTASEIEQICNEFAKLGYQREIYFMIILFAKNCYNLNSIKEILNKINEPKGIDYSIINFLTSKENYDKYNQFDIVNIVKCYIDNGHDLKIFDIFDLLNMNSIDKIQIIKTGEELYKIFKLVMEVNCIEAVKVLFNPEIQKRSIEDIKRIHDLYKKHDYRGISVLNDDLLSIEDIEEFIDTLEDKLISRFNINDIASEAEMDKYIKYLKKHFGSNEDIDILSISPKLKKTID